MYNVYAIYNKDHNKFYIGQTGDLVTRVKSHNNHLFKGYTARFTGIWQLIYSEVLATRKEALLREKQLKSYRGRELIKAYIPR
jgi:putative endonuclease